MTSLECIFGELGISQYLDAFIDQGFDSWDTILDITESDLDALGVKLGHRRVKTTQPPPPPLPCYSSPCYPSLCYPSPYFSSSPPPPPPPSKRSAPWLTACVKKLQRRIANSRGLGPGVSLVSPTRTSIEDGKVESSRSEAPATARSDNRDTSTVAKRKYRRHPKVRVWCPFFSLLYYFFSF